jgi:hypothetical protein
MVMALEIGVRDSEVSQQVWTKSTTRPKTSGTQKEEAALLAVRDH